MKCHFSDCGRYLHVTALEGQHKPDTKGRKKKKSDPSMNLALLVLTYRLCKKQTARSPPLLVHRTRVELGSVSSLSVSKLPYTLSWTPKHVYLTCRGSALQVYRIRLFNSTTGQASAVTSPREPIFLPCSAEQRDVYYFPPTDGGVIGRIIVGSESPSNNLNSLHLVAVDENSNLSPPVGCFMNEEEDLGGWIASTGLSKMPGNRGVGRLDRPLEQFNPEDDCDRECPHFL